MRDEGIEGERDGKHQEAVGAVRLGWQLGHGEADTESGRHGRSRERQAEMRSAKAPRWWYVMPTFAMLREHVHGRPRSAVLTRWQGDLIGRRTPSAEASALNVQKRQEAAAWASPH